MKVPVRLVRTDDGYDIVHRTERIHIRRLPEALSLSGRDIIAYLSLLKDDNPSDSEINEHSEIEEVLRRCHALQPG